MLCSDFVEEQGPNFKSSHRKAVGHTGENIGFIIKFCLCHLLMGHH
jgi:hypothetical protein